MASSPSGQNYGNVNVSDNATAILGDLYKAGDSWNIGHITFNVRHSDDIPSLGVIRGVKRRLLTDIPGDHDRNDPATDVSNTRVRTTEQLIKQQLRANSFSELLQTRILGSIFDSPRVGQIPEIQKRNASEQSSPTGQETVISQVHNKGSIEISSPILPLALVAGLLARNMSLETLRHFLSRMRNDPLFPLVTAIVGCWLMNFYNSLRARSLSDLSGDCVWFEDVYQMRVKMPFACFADSDTLSKFFSSHYRSTSAEQFVIDKQYNLFAGGRSGTPVTLEELCASNGVSEIYMAMLYRASFDTCLNCSNKISPNKFLSEGLQRCDYCRRQYRIYFNQTSPQTSNSNTSAFLLPHWRQPESLARVDGLGGMLNVDLNIQWKSHQNIGRLVRPVQSFSKKWLSDAAGFDPLAEDITQSPFGARKPNIDHVQSQSVADTQPPQKFESTFTSLTANLDDVASWQRTSFKTAHSRSSYNVHHQQDSEEEKVSANITSQKPILEQATQQGLPNDAEGEVGELPPIPLQLEMYMKEMTRQKTARGQFESINIDHDRKGFLEEVYQESLRYSRSAGVSPEPAQKT